MHHAHTNHVDLGETHVPEKIELCEAGKASGSMGLRGKLEQLLGRRAGSGLLGSVQLAAHLLIGWPAYILTGEHDALHS